MKILLIALMLLTGSAYALTLESGHLKAYCKIASHVGNTGFVVWEPRVEMERDSFNIFFYTVRNKCTRAGNGKIDWNVVDFPVNDTLYLLDWKRRWSTIVSYFSEDVFHFENGIQLKKFHVELGNNLFKKSELKKMNNGEILTKELNVHYANGSERSVVGDSSTYVRSLGYWILKYSVKQNEETEGYSVKVLSFKYDLK